MLKTKDALRSESRDEMRGGKGTVTLIHATNPSDAGIPAKLRVMAQIVVPVGASIGYHIHEGETEVYQILNGKGKVTDDDAIYEVEPGDVVVTASGHGHSVENIGDTELCFTAVVVLD